jgi:hypothetical protein
MIHIKGVHNLVYMSTSFEAINSQQTRYELMVRILQYFGLVSVSSCELDAEVRSDRIILSWTFSGQGINGFNLWRHAPSQTDVEGGTPILLTQSPLPISSSASFEDMQPVLGQEYVYCLNGISEHGEGEIARINVTFLPEKFLSQLRIEANHPNPFNPQTVIPFVIPAKGKVNVTIYDIMGRHVCTLLEKELEGGRHQIIWNGKNAKGADVSSGIYICRIECNNMAAFRKMMLIK